MTENLKNDKNINSNKFFILKDESEEFKAESDESKNKSEEDAAAAFTAEAAKAAENLKNTNKDNTEEEISTENET